MNIRIGHLSTVYHTALLMQGLGMLEKQGLNVSWSLFGGGPPIVDSMERGELDVGYIGLPPAMIGISRGAPIKCVAGGHMEGTAICSAKNLGEGEKQVIAELVGERIGCPPKGSIHDIIIRFLLRKHGVTAEIVNYPWADFIPLAMETGEINAAIGTPALAVFLKKNLGAQIVLPPNRIWPHNPSYGIIAREDFIDEPVLEIFIKSHEVANNLIINSPLEAAEILATVLGCVDPDFALEVFKLSPRFCSALPSEYIDSTMDFVPAMIELGYLESELKKEDIFHLDLIERIHSKPHHYNDSLRL
jgi:NitT/TauT family transport system substrate-binding protein